VLLLHDCPHAHETEDTFIGNGVVETLAAGGLNSTEAGSSSFTASVVQELAHAAHTTDWLSAVELHRRLINRLQAWTPTISFTDDTYSLVQVNRRTGQPMVEGPRRQTPTHSFLSKKPKTIVLTPLPPQTQRQSEDSLILLSPPTGQSEIIPDGPNILVTCRLRDQVVDAERWREWLLNAPEGGKGIQISAIFPGLGTVLIIELPLAVWDLLPSFPAISFVAYTTGSNHISEFRRALLGADPDESEDPSEDESDHGWAETRKARTGAWRKGTRRGKQAKEPLASPLWPKLFESNLTGIDATKYTSYCLSLAEMQGDDKTSKAVKVIRAFLQDADRPSMRYTYDVIQGFCAPASFEALTGSQEVAPDLVAIFDEPSPEGPLGRIHDMRFLSHGQLYEALAAVCAPSYLTDNR
jgi:hypothetical protein